MVICPSCRNENEEDSGVCSRCGTSLEPGVARLLPVRRDPSERPPVEFQQPKQTSKYRPVFILGTLALVLIGAGMFYLLRPNPCEGTNFESPNFGYCVLVPEGWEAGPAQFGDQVVLDQFAPPTSAATVVVASVDLEAGTGLEEFSAFVRQRDEEAGLTPGPTSETSLGGASALQWDMTVEEAGESYRLREIVTVRDEIGYRITLNDVEDGFSSSASALREMLDTWQFR
ncbi:MAG TPA: hypothetical protein VEC09_07665 [Actinomycetota bacterium]|nr:hypothetical protein [Actinomycetota bacterium]